MSRLRAGRYVLVRPRPGQLRPCHAVLRRLSRPADVRAAAPGNRRAIECGGPLATPGSPTL
eukprot:11426738-Prorocentrum_lima.AAC.1